MKKKKYTKEKGTPDIVEHLKEITTVVEKTRATYPNLGSPPKPLVHFEGEKYGKSLRTPILKKSWIKSPYSLRESSKTENSKYCHFHKTQ